MTKKTNSHEESLLCPQWGLSSSSKDNTPSLSTSFPLRNVSSSGSNTGQWCKNPGGGQRGWLLTDLHAAVCRFHSHKDQSKGVLIENDNRCPTPGACVWVRPRPLCLPRSDEPGTYQLPSTMWHAGSGDTV